MARNSSRTASTRNAGSRAATQRATPQTTHTSQFYIPPEVIPKGFTYRWVAVAHDSAGTPNQQNWQAKFTAGWRPVPRDRHLDMFPPIPNVGFGEDTSDVINRGGQILCEKPTAEVERDRAAIEAHSRQQMEAIDWTQDVSANPFAKTLPRVDNGSNTTFGHMAAFKND
jgi:hypothetical protein